MRRGRSLAASSSNETSWTVDPEIHAQNDCLYIGLLSVKTKRFLKVSTIGDVSATGDRYTDDNSRFRATLEIKGNIIIVNRYIHAFLTPYKNGYVNFRKAGMDSTNIFAIRRKYDKIGFLTEFGTYIGVNDKGVVSANSKSMGEEQQFEVYPQHCLKKDDCTQDLPIHGERWKLLNVEYDTDKSHIYEYAPRRVTMQHIDNTRSSIEQSSTFTASRTISETVSYSHTAGVGISVGTEFKAGIPLIGEAKASVQLTADYQFSYGKQRTVERTYSSQYDCVAPPGKDMYLPKVKLFHFPYHCSLLSTYKK